MQTRILQMGAAIAAAVLVALMVARTEAFASGQEKCSTDQRGRPRRVRAPMAPRPLAMRPPAHPTQLTANAAGGADADATSEASGGSDTKATAKGKMPTRQLRRKAAARPLAPRKERAPMRPRGHQAAAKRKQPRRARTPMQRLRRKAAARPSAPQKGESRRRECRGCHPAATLKQTALGADSTAQATATENGSNVTALATKGSTAVGSDTAAPICTPMKGGKAKVTSPMGNCG